MRLSECPNCGDGLIIKDKHAEIGKFIGTHEMYHVTCGENIMLIPEIDY